MFSDSGNGVVSGREKVGNNVEVNSAVFVQFVVFSSSVLGMSVVSPSLDCG